MNKIQIKTFLAIFVLFLLVQGSKAYFLSAILGCQTLPCRINQLENDVQSLKEQVRNLTKYLGPKQADESKIGANQANQVNQVPEINESQASNKRLRNQQLNYLNQQQQGNFYQI